MQIEINLIRNGNVSKIDTLASGNALKKILDYVNLEPNNPESLLIYISSYFIRCGVEYNFSFKVVENGGFELLQAGSYFSNESEFVVSVKKCHMNTGFVFNFVISSDVFRNTIFFVNECEKGPGRSEFENLISDISISSSDLVLKVEEFMGEYEDDFFEFFGLGLSLIGDVNVLSYLFPKDGCGMHVGNILVKSTNMVEVMNDAKETLRIVFCAREFFPYQPLLKSNTRFSFRKRFYQGLYYNYKSIIGSPLFAKILNVNDFDWLVRRINGYSCKRGFLEQNEVAERYWKLDLIAPSNKVKRKLEVLAVVLASSLSKEQIDAVLKSVDSSLRSLKNDSKPKSKQARKNRLKKD